MPTLSPRPNLLAISPLIWACEQATIIHPARGRIPFTPYPFQVRFLQDHSRRRLIVKARQIGMSQCVALEAAHKALYTPDSTILMVSRNEKLAANLLGYCHTAIRGVRDDVSELTRSSQSELGFANGSRILSLPANESTGRGFAAGDAYLDEAAFQLYAEDIYNAISPALSHGGRLTVLSSPNGRNNQFFQLWAGIEGGDWSRHEIKWSECPPYDDAWYAEMRPQFTAQRWASEFECDFIASGQAVFRDEDIKRCEDGWIGLQDAQLNHHYITAWDIGRRADATVGVTLDVSSEPWQLVAYERLLGVPYPSIQQRIELRHAAYPGEHWIESNGVGDPVMENLRVNVEPFTTTRKSKADAITALALAHEQSRLKHGVRQLAVECQLYQWDDKDLIQDSVMAAAIACWRADQFHPITGGMIHRETPQRQSFAMNLRGRR